jgi:hypothetical protein
MVDVEIPQWNPQRNVSFPAKLLGALITDDVDELLGRRFFAQVNIGADQAEDLFFEGFESAPDVPDEADLM